jgi:MHS family proline/betaine transporter-like MFS transporter
MTIAIVSEKKSASNLGLKKFIYVFPAILGTVIEYYDYALYGFCASLLTPHFFPTDDPTVALLKIFGVFLTGSLAKPFGALLFGILGDRFGRRLALQISMVGITIPTLMIGCLPSYATIGWLAPCLLLFCRILQGIFTAGESDGARIFLYESLGGVWQYFFNNLAGISCMVGIYLASVAAVWMQEFPASYAWRIPFIFGGFLGLLVYGFRYYLLESLAYLAYEKCGRKKSIPWIQAILQNKRCVIATIFLCGASGGTYHFYLVFLGNYLSTTLELISPERVRGIMSIGVLVYTLAGPISGLCADYFGAIRVIKIALIALLGVAYLNMMMLKQGEIQLGLMLTTAFLISFFQAPVFVMLFRQFNTAVRYRCIGVGHSVASMLFSGTAPFISLLFWQNTNVPEAPMIYFIFLILLAWIGIFLIENTKKKEIIPTLME